MSARSETGPPDAQNTLLLYCPYDRRVTRHVRRRTDQSVVCMECGRKVESPSDPDAAEPDAIHAQRTTAIPTITDSPAAPRSRRRQARRAGSSWAPLVLTFVILAIGAFAVFNVIGNFTSAEPDSAPPATSAPSVAQPQAPPAQPTTLRVANTEGQGVFLRRTPNLEDRLRAWPDNTILTVIGPDTNANGIQWKHVQDPAGNQGWVPAQFTVPG